MLMLRSATKKALSVSLAVILALCSFALCASAAGTPRVYVQDAECTVGGEFTVDILIENNPGIIAMMLKVNYDSSVLTLVKAENGNVFSQANSIFGNDISATPYTLIWEDSLARENNTANGTMAKLTFKVAEDAKASDSTIELECNGNSTFNVDLQKINFTAQSGKVTVNQVKQSFFARAWAKIVAAIELIVDGLKALFSFIIY